MNEENIGNVIKIKKRVIEDEGKLDFVKEKGEWKMEIKLWLDKKKKKEKKDGIYIIVVVNKKKDGKNIKGEVKL